MEMYTGKSIIEDMGRDWMETETSARRVAEYTAQLLNEKDKLLVVKDQQLRNCRIRHLKMEQKLDNAKRELINLSAII